MFMDAMAMKVFKFLQEHKELIEWDYVTFTSFICMAMEEWARANNENVVDVANKVSIAVKEINEELGKY